MRVKALEDKERRQREAEMRRLEQEQRMAQVTNAPLQGCASVSLCV